MASDTLPRVTKGGRVREKVSLSPGFHLSDWLMLLRSASIDFSGRGGKPPMKITKEELKKHNSKYDCWTAYKGKVYNISNYIPYHPGGEPKLLAIAGRDCTKEYDRYHPWVNIENMLSKCYVGLLEETVDSKEEEKEKEKEVNEDSKTSEAEENAEIASLSEGVATTTIKES